jgi:deazaflavin-dependent oxidoreductase (nitroreductase family)
VLILTTTGRRSGQERKTPVIYHRDEEGNYLVVASKGGAPAHPHWYLNLIANPIVTLQVKDETFRARARARTATDAEKASWWPQLTRAWPRYDLYLTKTSRNIPVVVLTPAPEHRAVP